jgi:hypothetical protein
VKIKQCDVCDEQFEWDREMIEMVIPAPFLNAEDGLGVDICSWTCVRQVVDSIDPLGDAVDEPEDGEIPEELGSEKPLKAKKMAEDPRTTMSEQELAAYTESVTGVKRRY